MFEEREEENLLGAAIMLGSSLVGLVGIFSFCIYLILSTFIF